MTITPQQRHNIHAAIDQAINHGVLPWISFHPQYKGDGALLRRLLEREFGAGEYTSSDEHPDQFWTTYIESGSGARITVHDGSPYLKDRPLNDRTQVDPIEGGTPVTVATTPHKGEGWVEATGPRYAYPNKADDAGIE